MNCYEYYFSDRSLIEALCRIRLNRAASIHRRRFYRKAFELDPETDFSELNRLFPPRRLWHKCRPNKRQRKDSVDPNFTALLQCIKKHLKADPVPTWAKEMERFIKKIQQAVLVDQSFTFRTPDIVPQLKKKPNVFRAIASFPNIEDKVVDIINAKYLRETLEVCLEDASRAFRSGHKRRLDRNRAIEDIFRIREAHPDAPLFITECDIRGFFDCVHHSVAKDALRRVAQTLRVRQPEAQIDPRALKVFNRYLDCYTFAQTALGQEKNLKKQAKRRDAIYKWPSGGDANQPNTLTHYHNNPKRCKIGVPQGGAHSCLIANLILDLADKEVSLALQASPGDSLYLRYCDDIIIITESEDSCHSATDAYYLALQAVKLPYHLPTELNGTAKQFFEDSKTKECFRWGPRDFSKRQFPWIQFLGYQIRFDRQIRIRPSSINKQRKKIEALSESLRKRIILKKAKVSHQALMHRFNSKLWAFSTGRVQIHTEHEEPLPMCWASGFRQLVNRRFEPGHIRKLDQVSGRERRRLRNHLRKFQSGPKSSSQPKNSKHLRYFGKPFSHLRQFGAPKP